MKPIFVINVASLSDVITNSSSELFVINSDAKKTKEDIITLLNSTYPNWKDEYLKPKSIQEIDESDLYWLYHLIARGENMYDEWMALHSYFVSKHKGDYKAALKSFMKNWNRNKQNTAYGKIAKKLGYKPEDFWEGFKEWKPRITTYEWKGSKNYTFDWYDLPTLSPLGENAVREYFKNAWFVYSIDENPNWDGQEKLEQIADRIHMG